MVSLEIQMTCSEAEKKGSGRQRTSTPQQEGQSHGGLWKDWTQDPGTRV